jgi:hypothetical protein
MINSAGYPVYLNARYRQQDRHGLVRPAQFDGGHQFTTDVISGKAPANKNFLQGREFMITMGYMPEAQMPSATIHNFHATLTWSGSGRCRSGIDPVSETIP